MNIIFGKDKAQEVDSKYVVLELDTFRINGYPEPVTAYCLVDQLLLEEIPMVNHFRDLQTNLMRNYRQRNWNFCEQAIEHLRGKWRGELDSFYDDLLERVNHLRDHEPAEDWDGVIQRDADHDKDVTPA